jgi:hypothetical protein
MIGLLVLGVGALIHGLGDKSTLLTVTGACDVGLAVLFLLAEPFVRGWCRNLLARTSRAEARAGRGVQ